MNILNPLYSTLFFALLCSQLFTAQAQTPTAPLGTDDLKLSAEEQEALAHEFDTMIDDMTKGMNEDQKNKFINDIVDEVEKISNMNEEQFSNYVKDLETEMQKLEATPEAHQPVPQPVASQPSGPQQAKPDISIEKEEKKPSRDMVPSIDTITSRLASFSQKAGQFVEIASNFTKWGEKGKLRGWNPTMTWPVFKEKIDTLKNTFITIKSLDPKTQRPKYLADLTANEALCNNINQFKTVLTRHEPTIQVPSFGLKTMSDGSKEAFIAVINDCLEALLALNLQTELEKIIAKYDPTAKKIKEAEERAQQAALEASKHRPTTPAAIKTTVSRGQEPGYYEFGVPGKAPYSPYMPMPSNYAPEKKDERMDKGTEKGPESKKIEEAKKEEPKGPASKKEEVKETETTKKIEQRYVDFMSQLEEARDIMEENEDSIHRHFASVKPADLEKLTSDIKALAHALNVAKKTASYARTAISDLDSGPQKDKWVKKFQTHWSENRADFMNLRDFLAR